MRSNLLHCLEWCRHLFLLWKMEKTPWIWFWLVIQNLFFSTKHHSFWLLFQKWGTVYCSYYCNWSNLFIFNFYFFKLLLSVYFIFLYIIHFTRSKHFFTSLSRYIFNQISSVITRTHLEKIFEQRRNYDLRRLLGNLLFGKSNNTKH